MMAGQDQGQAQPVRGVRLRCMRPCPPWGFCASVVTREQFVDGGCGGIHGHDGYVTRKQIEQEMREHGLAHLVERANEMGLSDV